MSGRVEFVEYTGEFPNLCKGTLTLEIDGETVKFGYDDDVDYEPFWESGGSTYFDSNLMGAYVEKGDWVINEEELPEIYQSLSREIEEVFNDNVKQGCCGGCI